MSNNYNLFLDDYRNPRDCGYTGKLGFYVNTTWIIVRSYDEFCKMIESKFEEGQVLPLVISFDHDLADEHYAPQHAWDNYDKWAEGKGGFKEKTGMDCAKWLVDFCMNKGVKLPEFLVHSMNPSGAKNISGLLENFRKFQENDDTRS